MAEDIVVKLEPIEYEDSSDDEFTPYAAPAVKTEPPESYFEVKMEIERGSPVDGLLESHGGDEYSGVRDEPADADDVCSSGVASSAEPAGAEGSPAAATVKREVGAGTAQTQPQDTHCAPSPFQSELAEDSPRIRCTEEQSAAVSAAVSAAMSASYGYQMIQPMDEADRERAAIFAQCKNGRQWRCDLCGKVFSRNTYLQAHLLRHKGILTHSCDICHKGFFQKGNLNQHMLIHTGEKPHFCETCNKAFARISHLRRHQVIHTDARPYVCSICQKTFQQRGDLSRHSMTHTDQKPHVCSVCQKGFRQIGSLNIHMLTHTGSMPHSCCVCKKEFRQKGNLNVHMLTHTKVKPHGCDICLKRFSNLKYLRKHYLTHTVPLPDPM